MTDDSAEVPVPPVEAVQPAAPLPEPTVIDAPSNVSPPKEAATVVPAAEVPAFTPQAVKEISEVITEGLQEVIMGEPAAPTAVTETSTVTSNVTPENAIPITARRGDALAKRRARKAEHLDEIIRYAGTHENFANDDIEELFRYSKRPVSNSSVQKHLSDLVAAGRLKRTGKGKASRYTL